MLGTMSKNGEQMNLLCKELANSYSGYKMTQSWADLYIWEHFLNENKANALIELGTAQGGFSWFLKSQCDGRGMAFHTFDCIDPRIDELNQIFGQPNERLPFPDLEEFRTIDILEETDFFQHLFNIYETVILFCDNGSKIKEVNEIASPYLISGDFLVAHDWNIEIEDKDIPSNFEMVHSNLCEELNSYTRFFKRL